MFSTVTKRAVFLRFLVCIVLCFVDHPRAEGAGIRYPASMCKLFAGPGISLYFSSMLANGLPARSEPSQNPGHQCPPGMAGGCPPCKEVAACKNDPKYNARVDCPIPKSFPDNGIEDVTVDVIDRHDVLDVECYLTSALWDPGSNRYETTYKKLNTHGSSNSIQPLKFDPMSAPGPAAHWYISCTLPAGSALDSYYVRETPFPLVRSTLPRE